MKSYQEAVRDFEQDRNQLVSLGIVLPSVRSYTPQHFKRDFEGAMDEMGMAMDALPTLTTDPNAGVPAILTTMIDPTIIRVLFSPNKAAMIVGEQKKGTWVDDTILFPIVENTGEVSSYGDYSNNGSTNANTNWPARQNYIYQTIKQYGERELERAGLAKINWVGELDMSAATVMHKYENLTYFFGVAGLQNYGLLNDPGLSAALTPALKGYGGVKWINNGVIVATANEIYLDIESLFLQLVNQSGGLIEATDKIVLAMSPGSAVALTATNSFNVNVNDLLKKNFPNIEIITAVQYGALSSSNPQGVAAGNFIQMIAPTVEGQQTAFAAYSEKMRAHAIVKELSAFKQKVSGGSWGTVIRQPFAISAMVGV